VLTKLTADNKLPEGINLPQNIPLFLSHLQSGVFYSLADSTLTKSTNDFLGKKILALAGIGQPVQFFETLESLGISISQSLAFDDHHEFVAGDIPSGFDAVLVTEKDAVKLQKFTLSNIWVLPVDATISPNLANWLMTQLKL
jgi:tetraacyldisaccharide 4'-kinase